jgi:hypothetical protein
MVLGRVGLWDKIAENDYRYKVHPEGTEFTAD